jgi:hypothetical protein
MFIKFSQEPLTVTLWLSGQNNDYSNEDILNPANLYTVPITMEVYVDLLRDTNNIVFGITMCGFDTNKATAEQHAFAKEHGIHLALYGYCFPFPPDSGADENLEKDAKLLENPHCFLNEMIDEEKQELIDDYEDSEQELHIFKNDGFLTIKDTNWNIIDIFNQTLSCERICELHRNGKPN